MALPTVQHLPAPVTLPDDGFAPPAMAALMTAPSTPLLQLRIRLQGAPANLPEAGIAVFQADHGSEHQWTPLTAGPPDEAGDRVFTVPVHARGDAVVTFAPQRPAARHGYLARVRVPLPGTGAPEEVRIDARTTLVTFHVPPGTERVGPIRLSRPDDPQWFPMDQPSTDFTLTDSEPPKVLLGTGNYAVSSPLQPSHRQTFAVPATQHLILQCAPAAPPTDRR